MMKNASYVLLSVLMLVLWTSCRKDFSTDPSTGDLLFSKDTVYLDTVFTNIGSSTYNLKVYNRSDNDIHIPTVRLGQGENSYYRLNIDGIAGKTFENIEIPAKDSIFVFVETTVDITDLSATALEFLYEDQIQFDSGANQQNVELVTLIKDAEFLYPERFPDGTTEMLNIGTVDDPVLIEGFFLDNTELNWTNNRPYVIYGYAAIADGDNLVVDPGARIHFHANSGLIAANNSTLTVNGAPSTDPVLLENEVIFEGDRLEPSFADVPGQWGAIWFTVGSTGHTINHATIKNASAGIIADATDLTISNSQIYNSSNLGIRARTATITGENLVIDNSGINSLAIEFGGTYDFTHCTFANYWNNSFRSDPSVYISNGPDIGIGPTPLAQANFRNCIIYGNENVELNLVNDSNMGAFNFKFDNTVIRFDPFGNPTLPVEYDFANTSLYENIVLNADPNFRDSTISDLIIGESSSANGIGNPAFQTTPNNDILGVSRSITSPDAGAYESVIFDD